VLVVGGGYIAVEFAGIFAGLGVDTTLSYRGPMFLRHFDEDVRQCVKEELTKKGIDLRFDSVVTEIIKQDDGSFNVTFEDGSSMNTELVLYATGRKPNVSDIGIENVDVACKENGAIKVNEFYRTSVANIFALGDVTDRIQLTPVAIAEAMAFASTQFKGEEKIMDYDGIATAVFCQPNIGTVGLTEAQAREQHPNIEVFLSQFRAMKHTLSGSDERTLMKLVVDKDSDRVLGIHMVGPEAGEIVQGLAVAYKAGATKALFDATVGIHPTSAEEFVTMREPVSS
jgi:glutathione reductase (NADPH)